MKKQATAVPLLAQGSSAPDQLDVGRLNSSLSALVLTSANGRNDTFLLGIMK